MRDARQEDCVDCVRKSENDIRKKRPSSDFSPCNDFQHQREWPVSLTQALVSTCLVSQI